MRVALSIDYLRPPRPQLERAAALEDDGLDMVWVPEAWGYDAPSLLGYLAGRTRRLTLASGILPVFSRTAALTAQTGAGLAEISGGRFELGLGTSGPQVVEGFHGVPFRDARARLADTVAVCRALWSGETSRFAGTGIRIPPADGTGLGRPMRLLAPGGVGRIPIHLAVMRPGMVELAARVADGWYPLLFTADGADPVWGAARARGAARRDPALGPLQIIVERACAIGQGTEVEAIREAARADIARYVGGMGARGANYYTDTAAALGWPDAARRIQDHYLGGDRAAASAAVPDEMLTALTLCGTATEVGDQVAALGRAGVTTLVVRPSGRDPGAVIPEIRAIVDAVAHGSFTG
jgi:F420-dependent oxidoreductase-like protein